MYRHFGTSPVRSFSLRPSRRSGFLNQTVARNVCPFVNRGVLNATELDIGDIFLKAKRLHVPQEPHLAGMATEGLDLFITA